MLKQSLGYVFRIRQFQAILEGFLIHQRELPGTIRIDCIQPLQDIGIFGGKRDNVPRLNCEYLRLGMVNNRPVTSEPGT